EAADTKVKNDTIKTQADTAKTQIDTVKTNAFGDMLSEVVNDSSLKVAPINQSANKQQTIPVNDTNKQVPTAENIPTTSLSDSLKKGQSQIPAMDTQNQKPATDTTAALN